jgi:hypothetical protein
MGMTTIATCDADASAETVPFPRPDADRIQGGPHPPGQEAVRRASTVATWRIEPLIRGASARRAPVERSLAARADVARSPVAHPPAGSLQPASRRRPTPNERPEGATAWHGGPGSGGSWQGRGGGSSLPRSAHRAQDRSRATRRAVVATAFLAGVLALIAVVSALAGHGPRPTVSDDRAPVASVAFVVAPGNSLWSIARQIQPHGDVRPLVDALAAEHGGRPLVPGDVLAWPPLPSRR